MHSGFSLMHMSMYSLYSSPSSSVHCCSGAPVQLVQTAHAEGLIRAAEGRVDTENGGCWLSHGHKSRPKCPKKLQS